MSTPLSTNLYSQRKCRVVFFYFDVYFSQINFVVSFFFITFAADSNSPCEGSGLDFHW